MKLLEWNIHKITNDILVKKYVIDTLVSADADILCLVEYLTDEGIEEKLRHKYWYEESNTISGNKVFIAVKKELAPEGLIVKNKNEVIDCYNFLHVDFVMPNEAILSMVGVRMLSPINASKQTLPLKRYLTKLSTSFLCAGDFNIKYYRMNKWFPGIANEIIVDTNSSLSDSSIIYVDKSTSEVTGFGAVDHVLHSDNIKVNSEYKWDFLARDSVYPNISSIDIGTIWSIPAAYPDHALMISDIEIKL
ncbi:endonuclease/exonuclease/phosphatase family protein [Anaerosacchariphilus polymeriproducens]|uniref:Endonuclease/exonuclease/phosphatase family protein n=1 Tax=Anaerosacchariphilus polymeriproducens TaxID=1812858 RepID=A0A371AQR1_9FIRM|nr:endonuclease/exonuclease/phosphatase family protein [Anaerosacchariphilus polymeriproducens]RDU21915.1 endonuclease/exonuclease/phosphatase family protein [Anaerosacchariphilus polymeriproducens]